MSRKDNDPAANGVEISDEVIHADYTARQALRDYLDVCLGDGGVLVVAVGSEPYRNAQGKIVHKHWTETAFDIPDAADKAHREEVVDRVVREILQAAAMHDVYLCPYLMRTRKRRKGNSVARTLVHADVDTDDLDTGKVEALSGFAVSTGTPGHAHVYVKLSQPVSVNDLDTLCRALGNHFGAPDVKCSDNDVLRPPGTHNYKPTVDGGERLPVKWLVPHDGATFDPESLARLLGVNLTNGKAKTRTNGHAGTGSERVNLDGYPRVKAAIDKDTGDRSEDTARIVGACVDAKLSVAQTRWCVNQHTGAAERLAGRTDDDVLTLWVKYTEDRQTRPPLAETRSGTRSAESLATQADSGAKDYEDFEIWPPPFAPYQVAQKVYESYRFGDDEMLTLLAWRGGWMRWETAHWSEIETAQIRSRVYDILSEAEYEEKDKDGNGKIKDWNPNRHKVADVLEAMAAVGYLSTDIDPPAWISSHADTPSHHDVISCTNGLLDLSTRTLVAHTPGLFNVVSVPFDYQENAAEPKVWLDFLDSLWHGDSESIALLQEYFGYVLSGRTDIQKMLFLLGPPRSGKGTIARMITALIGKGHVVGPTLASLGMNFGLQPLIGKPLAIISDARLGNSPSNIVVERLLSITGEDMLTIDRKYRDEWNGKLPTRLMVLSNELPAFKDSSGAIANRLLILEMTKSFLGQEDYTLDGRIAAELPGILLWALKGLDRLNENGRFTVPKSSEDAVNLMMELASPMSAFVRERLERGPGKEITCDQAFNEWKDWANANGHPVGSKPSFGRDLRSVLPGIKVAQKTEGMKRIRYYPNLGVAPINP
jgi:putative DNA primase/helicase